MDAFMRSRTQGTTSGQWLTSSSWVCQLYRTWHGVPEPPAYATTAGMEQKRTGLQGHTTRTVEYVQRKEVCWQFWHGLNIVSRTNFAHGGPLDGRFCTAGRRLLDFYLCPLETYAPCTHPDCARDAHPAGNNRRVVAHQHIG